ncbi:MAG: HNH endonuclease signature motif containing protein [Rikenellaceae bacterium]
MIDYINNLKERHVTHTVMGRRIAYNMPTKPKSPRRPWMPERKPQEGRYNSNSKFYHSPAWRKLRAMQMERQPLCEECLRNGIVRDANVADHITPINQGGEALDINNLQSLCHSCHNRKSGQEKHTTKR